MFSILKPFLFNLDPETAHDLAIKSLKYNPLPSKIFEVDDEQMLNIELFGKTFPNPIGLAEGFDKLGARPMPPINILHNDQQLADVMAYLLTLKSKKN